MFWPFAMTSRWAQHQSFRPANCGNCQ